MAIISNLFFLNTAIVWCRSNVPAILKLGHPELRKISREVTVEEIKTSLLIRTAVEDSIKTLIEFRARENFGRAIAAPQISYSIRMITMTRNLGKTFDVLFNPEIVYKSEELITMWDDCFSFPNVMVRLKRHKCVSVKFLNEEGSEELWERCPTPLSELLQHEIDHLNGILAVDLALKSDEANDESLIQRSEWLAKKEYYNKLVDYCA